MKETLDLKISSEQPIPTFDITSKVNGASFGKFIKLVKNEAGELTPVTNPKFSGKYIYGRVHDSAMKHLDIVREFKLPSGTLKQNILCIPAGMSVTAVSELKARTKVVKDFKTGNDKTIEIGGGYLVTVFSVRKPEFQQNKG